jgi:hypothetical protein
MAEIDYIEVKEEDLEVATLEQQKANREADVRAYERSLEQLHKNKENYITQLEVDKKIWEILEADDAMVYVGEAKFKFEQNPEYWRLQHEKNKFKIRESKAVADGTLKQMDDSIKQTEEALQRAKELLAACEVEKND